MPPLSVGGASFCNKLRHADQALKESSFLLYRSAIRERQRDSAELSRAVKDGAMAPRRG